MPVSGPIKWHGGKSYLAKKIVALMLPPHRNYVEPYFGGGAVLLAKDPEGVSEVVNDLDGELTNFWQVLQSPVGFLMMNRFLTVVPFSEVEWKQSHECKPEWPWPNWKRAACFFVRCRQSLAGRGKDFAPISTSRIRRGMNEQVSAWLGAIDGLPAVHARLKRVLILNRPALEVIKKFDGPDTVQYLDPPYMHSTRESAGQYAFEMTDDDHKEMLDLIKGLQSKFLVSGYRSDLYDKSLSNWTRHEFVLPNNAAAGKVKRKMTECLWCNF